MFWLCSFQRNLRMMQIAIPCFLRHQGVRRARTQNLDAHNFTKRAFYRHQHMYLHTYDTFITIHGATKVYEPSVETFANR